MQHPTKGHWFLRGDLRSPRFSIVGSSKKNVREASLLGLSKSLPTNKIMGGGNDLGFGLICVHMRWNSFEDLDTARLAN